MSSVPSTSHLEQPLLPADDPLSNIQHQTLATIPKSSSVFGLKKSGSFFPRDISKVQFSRTHFWLIVTSLLIAYFLSALDQTIVIVALPVIVSEFGHLELFGYIVSLYLITSAAVGPIFGKLSDVYGRRPLFLLALLIFMLGSILCGVSTSMYMLMGARALQGIGGGGLGMLNQIMFADIMTPEERAKFASLTSMMIAVASVAGPLIGGVFCDIGQWRWIFFINIPFIAISAGLAIKYITYQVKFKRKSIDAGGAFLSITGLSCLLLSFGIKGGYFWEYAESLSLLVVGVVLILLFFLWENKAESPIMPLHLFLIRNVSISNLAMASSNLAQLTTLSMLTLYFQTVSYYSAQTAGLWLLPLLLSLVVCATVTGHIMAKTSIYRPFLVIGNLFTAVGCGLFYLLTPNTPMWLICVFMVLIGLGYGFVAPVVKVISQNAVEQPDIAAVTVMTIFFRTIGGAFGTGLYGSLFLIFFQKYLIWNFGNTDYANLDPGQVRDNISGAALDTYFDCFSSSIGLTLFYVAPVMLESAIPGFFAQSVVLKKRKAVPNNTNGK